MKLFRFGGVGRERPGVVDAQGVARDISSLCADLSGAALSRANLERIRGADLQSLPVCLRPSGLDPVSAARATSSPWV